MAALIAAGRLTGRAEHMGQVVTGDAWFGVLEGRPEDGGPWNGREPVTVIPGCGCGRQVLLKDGKLPPAVLDLGDQPLVVEVGDRMFPDLHDIDRNRVV